MKFKTTILIVIILLISQVSIAQKDTVLDNNQLFTLLKSENQNAMRTGFCHTFEVTVNLEIIEITTTVTVCCSEEIYGCLPIPGNQMENASNSSPNSITIRNSNTITIGRNSISIKPGKYALNSSNEITNLNYIVKKK